MSSTSTRSEKDLEAAKPQPISHFRKVFSQARITTEVEKHDYDGSGTEQDPFVVTWIENDPGNAMNFSERRKWSITCLVALAALAVTFASSVLSAANDSILAEFPVNQTVNTLSTSLFVLGFALGPLVWAPCSEILGRQICFTVTYGVFTAFNAAVAGSQNIQTMIVLRFFAGLFGCSPLTNSGGVIADMFPAKQRGLALAFFSLAPFMGPSMGPIIGGFVSETVGWRWVAGVVSIFTGVLWLVISFSIPETYASVILRKRAAELSRRTGLVYKSRAEIEAGPISTTQVFEDALIRPWILLLREPIVLLLSLYLAIIYGTLYLLFSAYPIVFQEGRGWSPGIGGLAFIGVSTGMVIALGYSIIDNRRYGRISDEHKGFAPPEARLPPMMLGGCMIPIGLFWFAWTNYPSIHWIVPIMAGAPFGFGMVCVFLNLVSYLIDCYTIFAASVLAANSVVRSLFGAAFPLFAPYMYANLGIHWATCIPAFLALICVPMPFFFYRYGADIRKRCKFAAESAAFMSRMQQMAGKQAPAKDVPKAIPRVKPAPKRIESNASSEHSQDSNNSNDTYFEPIRAQIRREIKREIEEAYNANPFDMDRVNTRDSFMSGSKRNSFHAGQQRWSY